MNDEHLALVINFLHLRPAEVVCFARTLEREDSVMIYSQVQWCAFMILKIKIINISVGLFIRLEIYNDRSLIFNQAMY